jgi:nitroreductase
MELKQALLARRSVRSFTAEAVSDSDVDYLLHAGMSGPSAVNLRPWEFYVVKDPAKLAALNKVGYAKYPSPLMIVVAGNAHHFLPLGNEEYWEQDCSAATENILLAATDLSLGAVWCGVYPDKTRVKQVKEVLDLPENITPLNIIIIGHPQGEVPAPRDQYDEKKVHRV